MPIKPRNPNNVRSTTLGAAHEDHGHAHGDLTGVTANQHHDEAHTVASHSDTTATGAELEELTDGSETTLHTHAGILTQEEVEDFVGAMLSGNTETLITVTYQDGDGTIDFVVDADLSNYTNTPGWIADITGSPLSELSDVTITSIASGEILKWNGSAWINQTLAEAGISATGHTHTESEITDLDHTDTDAIHDNESGEIAAITAKTTPVDADVTIIEDSAATNAKKSLSWANIKATLETYFDTVYAALSHTHTESEITDLDHPHELVDLSDVNTSTPTNRNVLVADGVDWESRALVEADISDLDHYATADFTTDFAAEDLANLATKEAADLDATGATDGHVLTADGAGGAAWEAAAAGGGGGDAGLQDILMLGGM